MADEPTFNPRANHQSIFGRGADGCRYIQEGARFKHDHVFISWEDGYPKKSQQGAAPVRMTVDVDDMTVPQLQKLQKTLTGAGFGKVDGVMTTKTEMQDSLKATLAAGTG